MVLNIQVIANLFFLVLGLAYGGAALAIPKAAFGDPNAPKIYPLIIAAGLIGMSLALFAAEMKKQRAGTAEEKMVFKLGDEGKLVAFVSAVCVLYALLFDTLGYVISTFLFIEAVMVYISKGKKLLVPTIWAVIFAVGIYIVFGKVLAITLPPMPFLDI